MGGLGAVNSGTSLEFGPDGRLYVLSLKGQIDIFTIQRNDVDDYEVIAAEEILDVLNHPNHNDDGSAPIDIDDGGTVTQREATGITVVGTATNPVIYVTSSDPRVGGPGGDKDLDTNSGVITRITWTGSSWDAVDIVRGLPRSEENHATNGLEFVTIGATDYLIVSQGGHTNAGSPSDNFAWTTEYALSAALLSVNLTMLENTSNYPILIDNVSGRQYIYDIPTLDDPTRDNVNDITDPDVTGYNGIDINDPWGGNDGLNQAMLVVDGPVQIFSPGYRNTYDLTIYNNTVYVTDNGANGGWGGLPVNEGMDGTVTNDYVSSEPGSSSSIGGEQVDNTDHLTVVTTDLQNYDFGSFYGGHPTPVRANPMGAGLFTNPTENGTAGAIFRTLIFDPSNPGAGYTDDPTIALPANWPPVPESLKNIDEGDWRGPVTTNPDGPDDALVTAWENNTNGIDAYTASNFEGAMLGDLIAGSNKNELRRVQVDSNGNLVDYTESFLSGLGGNSLGITCNGDLDPFPGTIWVATFNSNIKIFEPQDFGPCILPGEAGYSSTGDNDFDGYTNEDEIQNKDSDQLDEEVICNGGNQPDDFDKAAGGTLISDLNDTDDDNDGIDDANDPFQLGDPLDSGTDSFDLPVINELLSDNPELKGYLGLGLTGLMNNGTPNPNWLNWLDVQDAGPNPNDILGGATGAMTMEMTSGTALGGSNNQDKGFQYGVNVDQNTGVFIVEGRLFNFIDPLQLYGSSAPEDGELGFFIGDGTQSNYIKFVISQNGLQALQEINDNPQTPIDLAILSGNRPTNDVIFRFVIDPSSGVVTLDYDFDSSGTFETLGTVNAQGSIMDAIQNSNSPLAVGLIGSSNTDGVEVQGTWDYLNVQGSQPTIEQDIADVSAFIGDLPISIDLDDYFSDDQGDALLDYTIEENTSGAIQAEITGSTLDITFPGVEDSGSITVRATDDDDLYIEQVLLVSVSDEPVPIIRIRANGATISATDAPNPDWIGITDVGAQSGTFNSIAFSVNTGNHSTQNIANKSLVVPTYVPQEIYTNERWDPDTGAEMEWTFDLTNGSYLVRLYMGNGYSGTSAVGERVFDISIENELRTDNLDLVQTFGHQVGGMVEYFVELSDGTLNILFERVVENPLVNGIEILSVGGAYTPPISVNTIADQSNIEGDLVNFDIVASGGDSSQNLSYSETGLPPGISLEPTTGNINGTIESGSTLNSPYNVTITVSRGTSVPVEVDFVWTISETVGDQWTNQTDDENFTARHECSFVQAGDKFYLIGGRENATSLDVYDYQSKTWSTISNSAPAEFNHYQALEYNGLIWVIGAFKTNSFPNEAPADYVWAYNPATNDWVQGPEIPEGRKRGSAGLVMYNDKFYIVAGNTIGHNGGYISWFDEFDPATGVWTELADAPRSRDHFHAAVIDDKLYVAGGRLSGGDGGTFMPLIADVDVYDFTTGTWSTLPSDQNIPTPRAAASTAVFQDELYIIGGEIENDLEGNTINDAVKTTEAYNPVTGTWSTKANLVTERHGTQAIVSGGGIHVVAGSNTKGGGGTMKNMEFYGVDNPTGVSLTAGELTGPSMAVVPTSGAKQITFNHSSGNTGAVITDAIVSGPDASEFNVATNTDFRFVAPGETTSIVVSHIGSEDGKVATLNVTYDDGTTLAVSLVSGDAVETVLYRVNGGGQTAVAADGSSLDWSPDTGDFGDTGNSPYLSANSTGTGTYAQTTESAYKGPIDMSDPSLPEGVPESVFTTERYDGASIPEMLWQFPVEPNAQIEVRLYFAELYSGITEADQRVFDVSVEGTVPAVFDDIDPFARNGALGAFMLSHMVTVTDGTLDLEFIHIIENPAVKAIEIIDLGTVIPDNSPSLVTNPGPQIGVEGDEVNLQIFASDVDPCDGLVYSAEGLPPSLAINSQTGIITGTLDMGSGSGVSGAFIEDDGLVIIEAETDFVDTSGGYDLLNENGEDFLVATSNHFGNVNGQTLAYNVQITTTGVYRLHMKSNITGTNGSESNDSWFKIDNTNDVHFFCVEGGNLSGGQQFFDILDGTNTDKTLYYPAGNAMGRPDHGNENPGNSGFFKVYRGGNDGNKWSTFTIDSNAFAIYAYFENPGTYTVYLSERSAGHKLDRFSLVHIDEISAGKPTSTMNGAQSEQVTGVVPGAADNSPYDVTVTVADQCDPTESSTMEFVWGVTTMPLANPSAFVQVTPGADLDISTFGNDSFIITNTGEDFITNVKVSTANGYMMDVVFDPVGTAGDNGAKCLTAGTSGNSAQEVGLTVPADGGSDVEDCENVFSKPHNGINNSEGYDEISLDFTDFEPGESFAFGIDMDPTSIKGDLSTGDAGSISGFEFIGGVVTVQFATGAVFTTSLFDEGSLGGADAILTPTSNDLTVPNISVGGTAENRFVDDFNQTIDIVGAPNTSVTLLRVDGRLYIDPGNPNIGYDVDTFEANEAMTKELYSVTLDGSGQASVPVVLTETPGSSGTPDGGINHFIAVTNGVNGENSVASNTIVLEYDPDALGGDITLSYTLQGRTDFTMDLTVDIYEQGNSEPIYQFTPVGSENGEVTVNGIEPGTYQIAVKSANYLQKVQTVTVLGNENNPVDMGELKAGDANNDNFITILDFSILSNSFGLESADPEFDLSADFNGDGFITIVDFSLLSSNFGTAGEQPQLE
ncbi:ring canal kelch-like protein [Flagellimonas eckloniae]|uniref:Ring canal kelch-like protein n=2 Tax=Flagellimonas eckloniae TaxID=346185 RepID=A0A0Q0XL43_9FLAO|nr:ring canal kelch-like protein [Allomuricauda eckloniae]